MLAVRAPGTRSLDVPWANRAIDGSLKAVPLRSGEAINLTFLPGEYIVVAVDEGNTNEAQTAVVADERSDAAIPAP